ncbi:hypothetical protein C6V83_18025 [Gordonia iterans]|uniref:Uncharacterized protein n=1 Tax=Gordonia iterans TaxID=1004901 RepID=A0A2S0KJP9_9ACTN|nr:hypothetical protein C6V83_18025 [Gordonia iterans]
MMVTWFDSSPDGTHSRYTFVHRSAGISVVAVFVVALPEFGRAVTVIVDPLRLICTVFAPEAPPS